MIRALVLCIIFSASLVSLEAQSAVATVRANVEFPGPQPGMAQASEKNSIWTLENSVISASWKLRDGFLEPSSLANLLTGVPFDQTGRVLFRLSTTAVTQAKTKGVACAVRMDDQKIHILVSHDGIAWSELAAFPRTDFPGDPKLIRIGKMNGQGEAKSHSNNGPLGEGSIFELSPCPNTLIEGRFDFKATADEAKVAEYPYPAGRRKVSCRIDKGTDQGQTWGPGIALIWEDGVRFLSVGVRNHSTPLHPVFTVCTKAGEQILGVQLPSYSQFNLDSRAFHLEGNPKLVSINGDAKGGRLAERFSGKSIECQLTSEQGIRATWRAELRNDSNYIRQSVSLTSPNRAIELYGVEMIDLSLPDMQTVGRVPGCPMAGSGVFAGVEMPGSQNAMSDDSARIGFNCQLIVTPKQSYQFSSVIGVAPAKQLRRAFLYYVERERARPSIPFLHYNGWYDAAPSAEQIMGVVKHFHEELVIKRGVPICSYLVDDGWDSVNEGLWKESPQLFPGGFKALKGQMEKQGGRLGVWISPLGGYNGDKERTSLAQKMKLIPENGKLDFSHPAYKQWFQDRCAQLMREGGVNAFKWDKAGDGVSPHFMALLDIAHQLRRVDPKLFINVTVGTWPSPFWLNHIDSTWRIHGGDVGWSGKGNDPSNEAFNREKWLTFRDGYCRQSFVEASPLYPLNSAMHHGIVHGLHYQGGSIGKSNPPDLKNEARSYFANGATLQELYLSYSLMTAEAWDQVADAAKWGRANADVLVDSHWVGGDPLKLEIYGYAAWNYRKGTLMLRNPDDKSQSFTFDIGQALDLPPGAASSYSLKSPYPDQRIKALMGKVGTQITVTLQPFEVLVFDANPLRL